MPKDVKTLKKYARRFIIHFETISENDTDQIFTAGSKVLDILDCDIYAAHRIKRLTIKDNYVYLQVYKILINKYEIHNLIFTDVLLYK